MSTVRHMNSWKKHPIVHQIDRNGYIITRQGGRIAGHVNPDHISGEAVIRGNSLVEGEHSCVQGSASIEDSYCINAEIDNRAIIKKSLLISTGNSFQHKCDPAGKYVVQGANVRIGPNSEIVSCYLTNTSIAENCSIINSSFTNCNIGSCNKITKTKMVLAHSENGVTLEGPTEISEAWLGRKTHINRLGYFEGVFLNEFPVLDYDEQNGKLIVRDILDIPHVSEYGRNTIISTNSGRLLNQPRGIMKDFGPQVQLWHDSLLSHDPVLLGPCCWVCPWTKVIGKSAGIHSSHDNTSVDMLLTYLMPFSVSGLQSDSVCGLSAPGERAVDYGYKNRCGGWVFDHCRNAVIRMVARLYQALDPHEKDKADIVVKASLNNALCLVKYWADQWHLNLNEPRHQQPDGKAKWLWDYRNVILAHMDADIWNFKNGKIVSGKPALQDQSEISEDELMAEPEEMKTDDIRLANALCENDLKETTISEGFIHPNADIHPIAVIDSSAQIGAGAIIKERARIGPGTVVKGRTTVGRNTRLFRTILENTTVGHDSRLTHCQILGSNEQICKIGNRVELTGCKIINSEISDHTSGVDAKVSNSKLAHHTNLAMFAAVDHVVSTRPMIIGGIMSDSRIDTPLMSMHAAGKIEGLMAKPVHLNIDGQTMEMPAVPMLGGGCRIRGRDTAENAVILEGCFIGSNTIIESNTYVGFGSFILGHLGPDEGLLPFTVSTHPGPQADDIGGVLIRFPNMVITHFIGWTWQALPPEHADLIVHLITHQIMRGIKLIRNELDRRKQGLPWDGQQGHTLFKSLPIYSEQQLINGLRNYEESLKQGRWEMQCDGINLFFTNNNGHWAVKDGRVRWKKKACEQIRRRSS